MDRKVFLELLHFWVWSKTVHVVHVHLHPHLPGQRSQKNCGALTHLVNPSLSTSADAKWINPSLPSLGDDQAICFAATSTKCWCTFQLPANDFKYSSGWFYNHHVVQLWSLMKGICAIQSEGWHTLLERENVHNSTSSVRSSRGEEVFPEHLPLCIRVPPSATLYSHSLLRLLQVFLPPGGQVFHANTFISCNVPHNSVFQQAIQRSLGGCRVYVWFHLAVESLCAAISRLRREPHLLLVKRLDSQISPCLTLSLDLLVVRCHP